MFQSQSDTIAAIATASTGGGVSIIRISGKEAVEKTEGILSFSSKKLSEFGSHTVHYGHVVDKRRVGDKSHLTDDAYLAEGSGKVIDEVLVLIMREPNSYTREDVVEIQCHGSALVCQEILDLLLSNGIRMAEPGEFTKRAFLNGRIDLSQAEAVMDLIESKSRYALESSVSQLNGIIKYKVKEIRSMILDDVAFIEAALDDPEHLSMDGFREKFEQNILYAMSELKKMIENYRNGRLIRQGVQTVIIGKPNVGKSSFLNAILGTDRAIVTNVPGTTRDTLEEDVRLGDLLLHLIDTAGIHDTDDPVEKIGIERAKENLERADFCILIIDGSSELTEADKKLLLDISEMNSVVLLNKNDLHVKVQEEDIRKYTDKKVISFSAQTGSGKDELEQYIKEQFYLDHLSFNDEIYISNERQKQAVVSSYDSLKNVKESLDLDMGEDFYTIDLMSAYESLGTMIGESLDDELADTIFRKFCMGK